MPRWEDARRIEEWAGEVRVNLIRVAALVAFYGYHLLDVYVLRHGPLDPAYHRAVTLLALVWGFAAAAIHFSLARRFVPPWLKYAATGWDTVMTTVLLMMSGGAGHTLAALYFLVIAAAPLRLSLRLVWAAMFATGGAYIVLLGHARFYAMSQQIPRTRQVLFLLALGAAGLLAGQAVRQARRLLEGYTVRVKEQG